MRQTEEGVWQEVTGLCRCWVGGLLQRVALSGDMNEGMEPTIKRRGETENTDTEESTRVDILSQNWQEYEGHRRTVSK